MRATIARPHSNLVECDSKKPRRVTVMPMMVTTLVVVVDGAPRQAGKEDTLIQICIRARAGMKYEKMERGERREEIKKEKLK